MTGTALAGTVREGETVRVLPTQSEARVRSLQVHGEDMSEAHWGQRVALNLVGLDKADMARGHVVCHPKVSMTTTRFDASVEIRPSAGREVVNHERVRIHLGTAEVIGKIILLGGHEVLPPKSTALCQIIAQEPLVALRGDHFVLRNQTAQGTLGGGVVVNPFAQRHRKAETQVTERLHALQTLDLREACHAYLEVCPQFAVRLDEIYHGVNTREEEITALLANDAAILPFPDAQHPEAYSIATKWQRLVAAVEKMLTVFHAQTPLAQGMEMESVRSQLPFSLTPKIFRAVAERLIAEGIVVRHESLLRLPSHTVSLSQEEQAIAARLERLVPRRTIHPTGHEGAGGVAATSS